MAFHFTNFHISGASFNFYDFQAEVPDGGDPYPLDITVFTQPTDRYTELKGILPSVAIFISSHQLPTLPLNFNGFIIERSDDSGLTWNDISGLVQGAHFYIDIPPAPGMYMYRAKMQSFTGVVSDGGNEVPVTVGKWGDIDDLGVSEIEVGTGLLINRLSRHTPFPNGFDGEAQTGMSISESSLGGGYAGLWYMGSGEIEPPIIFNHSPSCGLLGIPLPVTILTFQIQDKPYPGGSGIDDSTLIIKLSVSSQYSGADMLVRHGANQPMVPVITCVVVPGVDPLLDRTVTITVPVGYIQSDDVVVVTTEVKDLSGNLVVDSCEFTVEHQDNIPPEILNEDPTCGTGVDPESEERASINTPFAFQVQDLDSGVDQTSLQVFYGNTSIGPWTQVIQNGSVFLGGFTGSVVSDGLGGFDVSIARPSLDPYWPANSLVCFRIDVSDLDGNFISEVCCFRVNDLARLRRVVPIAEDILFVEFTIPMANDDNFRNPANYSVTPIAGSQAEPVVVKSVLAQQFAAQKDPNAPAFRLGDGYPTFLYLNTTPNTDWELSQLTVGATLKDRYGVYIDPAGREAQYRGRRTKVDEGRDALDGFVVREDSLIRRALVGIFHGDAQIGDVYVPDDWEKE